MLGQQPEIARIPADDHSALLSLITQHTLPSVAEAHSLTVVTRMRMLGIPLDIRDYHAQMMIHLGTLNRAKMLAALEKMTQEEGIRPDVTCFNLVMALFARLGDLDALTDMWMRCLSAHPASRLVNADAWAIMIDGYARAGDFEGAERLYEHYKALAGARGPEPLSALPNGPFGSEAAPVNALQVKSRVVHEAFIRALGLTGRLDDAKALFQQLLDQAQDPVHGNPHTVDEHLYDAIIEACQACGDLAGAETYWKGVLSLCDSWRLDTSPSLPSLPSFIHISKESDEPSERYNKNSHSNADGKTKTVQHYWGTPRPLSATYARMINLYTRATRVHDAMLLFNEQLQAMQPNAQTYEEIIRMQLRIGNERLAVRLFDKMVWRGYRPSVDLVLVMPTRK
ncbi:hypothetical protein BC831DRAFT_467133 [Entophlyctis helioformis]|nr:hypothetical protein BC831DRAFT_467133 [Entophlyctis helioformis]